MSEQRRGTIEERGNGFPDLGDYVKGDDGEVYVVRRLGRSIETGRTGNPNVIPGCDLELADWANVDDDTEPTCTVVLEKGGDDE